MDTDRPSTGGDVTGFSTGRSRRPSLGFPVRVRTVTAGLLAACVPGAGHLLVREWTRGLSWAALYVLALLFFGSGHLVAGGEIAGSFVVSAVWLDGVAFGELAVPLAIVVLNVIDLYARSVLAGR